MIKMKKNKINDVKVVLDSKSENEAFARYICAAFCSAYNPPVDTLADIKCTVSEAVTNAVVHAYRDRPGKIYITLCAYDDMSVSVTVRDRGCGIEDLKLAREPLYTTDAAGERSGMGFPIMENLSDKFKVTSKPGIGTTVTMYYKLKREVSDNG
jgi:stage II sporulation protein AB (anti-sigma F factor)